GYSFFLLGDARKNIALNLGITGVFGYETINKGEPMLNDGAKLLSDDNFIYGAGGRLTFETYLSDRFVLVLQ
ncbi:conjugal transfer protein TraO, partial [Klebsiella pneumoniae]|uniref:conjugal transfer protein TraO n=2 Tax=Pseudomonadati TaxID=3379134 RepID=UPI0019532D9A